MKKDEACSDDGKMNAVEIMYDNKYFDMRKINFFMLSLLVFVAACTQGVAKRVMVIIPFGQRFLLVQQDSNTWWG